MPRPRVRSDSAVQYNVQGHELFCTLRPAPDPAQHAWSQLLLQNNFLAKAGHRNL